MADDPDFDKKLLKAVETAIDRWADKKYKEIGKWSVGIIIIGALTVLMHFFVKIEMVNK